MVKGLKRKSKKSLLCKRRITRRIRHYYSKGGSIPLKVAILFTGRIKGYENTKDNLKKIKDTYNATVFCSLNKKIKSDYIKGFCEFMDITDDRLNLEPTPRAPDFMRNPDIPKNDHKKSGKWGDSNDPTQNFYSLIYHRKKACLLVEEYQKIHNIHFDILLYYRVDIDTSESLVLSIPVKENTLYTPPEQYDSLGIASAMNYGSFQTMKIFSNIIDSLENIVMIQGIILNDEATLKKHIENNNISIERIPYHFNLHPSRHDPNPAYNDFE